MKLIKSIVVAGAVMVAASSCQVVKVTSPTNGVQLASESENLTSRVRKKEFYLIGGLIPLNNTRTADIIAQNGFTKVRIDTRYNILDALVSGITFGIVHIRTTTVEGSK